MCFKTLFLRCFATSIHLKAVQKLYTWMYRIACNEAINHRKRIAKMRIVGLEDSGKKAADSYIDVSTLNRDLETAIAKLPERQQTVFRMRYFYELSYKEISEILQVSEGALKASFHHAVKKIEEEFRAKQIL